MTVSGEVARVVEAVVATEKRHRNETIDRLVRTCRTDLMNKVRYVIVGGKLDDKATTRVFSHLGYLAEVDSPLMRNVLEVFVSTPERVATARNRLAGKVLAMSEVIEAGWSFRRR
jgi:hypothetical protein